MRLFTPMALYRSHTRRMSRQWPEVKHSLNRFPLLEYQCTYFIHNHTNQPFTNWSNSVQELNAGNNTGCKHEPFTQNAKAHRSTSFDDYYLPVQNRTNLKVLTMSPVQQLILKPSNGTVVATGVVYIDYATGQTLNVTANKEVIVSAGAIKTPHILMLSVGHPT